MTASVWEHIANPCDRCQGPVEQHGYRRESPVTVSSFLIDPATRGNCLRCRHYRLENIRYFCDVASRYEMMELIGEAFNHSDGDARMNATWAIQYKQAKEAD